MVVKRIEDIDRLGFPMHVDHVRKMALKVLQEQEGTETLGKHWIPQFLNRHYCIVLYLSPALNPMSYGRARLYKAPGRPMLVIGRD